MVKELKSKVKVGVKVGAVVGFGLGVALSVAAKLDEMGNLEFILRGSGTTMGSTVIGSLGGAVISTILYYKHKYVYGRSSKDYTS